MNVTSGCVVIYIYKIAFVFIGYLKVTASYTNWALRLLFHCLNEKYKHTLYPAFEMISLNVLHGH